MSEKKIKFVGLHQHSHYSVYDGFGKPNEAMDYVYENGDKALALTDHGTMAGLAEQVLHAKEMNKQGKDFKPIYGVEAYYHPSIALWQEQFESQSKTKKSKKEKEAGEGSVLIEDEDDLISVVGDGDLALRHRRHMILLAKNPVGLKNLFTMISKSYTRPYYYFYPRIDLELLKEHSEGIIATNACIGGILGLDYFLNEENGEKAVRIAMRKTVENMIEIYGKDFLGELQWNALEAQHHINKHVIELSKEYDFELISSADAHFPSPEHWKNREIYKRLGWVGEREKGELPETIDGMEYQLYPKDGSQMWESYKKYSKQLGFEYDDSVILNSIEKTHDVAFNRIEKFYPDNSIKLPSFVIDTDKDFDKELTKRSFEGLKKKIGLDDQTYIDRLQKELKVIAKKGFSRYFLTTQRMVEIAKEYMFVAPARGSGAGSLVDYCLDITEVDPLRWNLQFERFLRADDDAYPDIDVDIEDPMEFKEYLVEMWGSDSVAPVTNWVTLKIKSAIKDLSKMEGIPYGEVNDVTTKMDAEAVPAAKKAAGIKSGVYEPSFDEYKQYSQSFSEFLSKYPQLEHPIKSMLGANKAISRHAGGLIVGDNLGSTLPLIRSKGVIQTPWHKDLLEPMGFIKFDLLGLGTLRMMRSCVERILKRETGKKPAFAEVKKWYDDKLSPETIDFDDPKVWEVFQKGKWFSTFQFTQRGAQTFCMQVNPQNIVQLSVVTSIFRPSALEANVHRDYLRALENPESVKYLNSIHEDVTKESLSFCIFQEQIAELAHRLGKGISLDEGNLLRKLFVKRGNKNSEKIASIKEKFMEGCFENSLAEEQAEELFTTFEYFSGYGFNKSHAVSYAMISYQCAFLWTYYPAFWAASVLDEEKDNSKLEALIAKARAFGLEIESPKINHSSMKWEVGQNSKTLYQPLISINGIAEKFYEQIEPHRPFSSIEDMLFHNEMKTPNKTALSALIRCQALEDLMDSRFTGSKHFWTAVAVDKPKDLEHLQLNIDNELYREEGDFSKEEKIALMADLTKIFPMRMIVTEKSEEIMRKGGVLPISEWDGNKRKYWFIPRDCQVKKDRNGRTYWNLRATDSSFQQINVRCWNIQTEDIIFINQLYIADFIDKDKWGFSTGWKRENSPSSNFTLV